MQTRFLWIISRLFLLLLISPLQAVQARPSDLPLLQEAFPTPELIPPSPADVINAVNNLRLSNRLNALSIHAVLMEVAAQQANALAASEGTIG